jgi:diacylglycerol kinase family enzyme
MDVSIIKKVNPFKLLWTGFCLLIKKPNWSSDVEIISTKKMKIKFAEGVKFQIDGDPYLFTEDLNIEMLKGDLNFLVRN